MRRRPRLSLPALPCCVLVLLTACGDGSGGGSPLPGWARLSGTASGPDRLAVVVTTDWSSGGISVVDLATREAWPLVALVHSDALARYHEGLLYVVNRLGQDNLQLLDASYSTVAQLSLGNGSNPQDVAFLPGGARALVSRYAADPLLLPLPAGSPAVTLDLAAWRDADGSAETSFMAVSGEHVLIAAQRLDHYQPTGRSVILDYDPASGQLAGHPTTGDNPYSPLYADPCRPGGFLVGTVGRFGTLDHGGVERIGADGVSQGLLLEEAQLGGEVLSLALAADGSAGFALLAVPGADAGHQETRLVRFGGCAAQQAGTVEVTTVLSPGSWTLGGLAVDDRNELYVADRSPAAPGLRVFDVASVAERTAQPIDVGLPPFQILFVP